MHLLPLELAGICSELPHRKNTKAGCLNCSGFLGWEVIEKNKGVEEEMDQKAG